ncbi:hypothetical protein NHG23_08485 [Aerococcaceae bacterium NML190073]|nr:hypothetical protein [Aerococcaceae bacterium NML190073]
MMKIKLHPYDLNSCEEAKDWRGNDIINGRLYHSIDFAGETYIVAKCDIGDFYEYFGCLTDDGNWNINGETILDRLLDGWVADMWGRALHGVYW